jgi:hypothetical protein
MVGVEFETLKCEWSLARYEWRHGFPCYLGSQPPQEFCTGVELGLSSRNIVSQIG